MQAVQESLSMSLFGVSNSLDHVRLRGGQISQILASLQFRPASDIRNRLEWESSRGTLV
jgi:hypothetical protein